MNRVLACTDFSDSAHGALVRAVALAVQSTASLEILHASADQLGVRETRQAILASARSEAEAMGSASLDIRVHILTRRAEDAILALAERCGVDLIVLGGHSRPRFRDAVFGTVGTHIVRHSPVPVLIVQTDPTLPYTRLMVAADRPEAAPRLVKRALGIAPAAEVFAIHAFRTGFIDRLGGDEVLDDLAARDLAAMRTELARVAAAYPEALLEAHGHVVSRPGDVTLVLMDEAERLLPDLVVMGTRPRSTYLGSRAVEACFWCPADLLIVPEPGQAASSEPAPGGTVVA
jgi:nucleotide-binding universal stress UspA family protein